VRSYPISVTVQFSHFSTVTRITPYLTLPHVGPRPHPGASGDTLVLHPRVRHDSWFHWSRQMQLKFIERRDPRNWILRRLAGADERDATIPEVDGGLNEIVTVIDEQELVDW